VLSRAYYDADAEFDYPYGILILLSLQSFYSSLVSVKPNGRPSSDGRTFCLAVW
jgi:hypothetical protein